MITGTSASASVIISFQGTSATGYIDPDLNWTLDITVDNGGGGSIYDQTWEGTDITEFTLSRGSYQYTATPYTAAISVGTDPLGEFTETRFDLMMTPTGSDGPTGPWDPIVAGSYMQTSFGVHDINSQSTRSAMQIQSDHTGWSVSPMSNPAVPEPTSAIVWACLLTVGCLGKRSFYSLSNRSRPKSTNV